MPSLPEPSGLPAGLSAVTDGRVEAVAAETSDPEGAFLTGMGDVSETLRLAILAIASGVGP